VLRTDDGGATWKDLETGISSNLFSVALAGRNDVLIAGEQGRIIHSKDAGQTWEVQPTITSSSLYSVAYRGGNNIWVAGHGGAILRRLEPIATVRIPVSRIPPLLRGGSKTQGINPENAIDDGDIPRAVPPKKPVRQ
jgi:photosystem II stability/assembly factor-like uncharacterized protein